MQIFDLQSEAVQANRRARSLACSASLSKQPKVRVPLVPKGLTKTAVFVRLDRRYAFVQGTFGLQTPLQKCRFCKRSLTKASLLCARLRVCKPHKSFAFVRKATGL